MIGPQGTLAELRALSGELQGVLKEVLAPGRPIPSSCDEYLARGARRVALNKANSVKDLVLAVRLLGVFRLTDRVVAAGDVLARVPFTGNHTIYSPYVSVFGLAARMSSVAGDTVTAARLLERLSWPDLATREQLLAEESTQNRLRGLLLKFPLDEETTVPVPFAGQLDRLLGECLELDFMWAGGGSAEWPTGRIEAEIARNEGRVVELAG